MLLQGRYTDSLVWPSSKPSAFALLTPFVVLGLGVACGAGSAADATGDAGQPDGRPPPPTCAATDLPQPPLLEPGSFRLSVIGGSGWGPGARIELEPDGAISGHGWEDLWMCAGTIDSDELDGLTGALNEVDILRACSNPQPCADHTIYVIDIEATSGAAQGWGNQIVYEVCMNEPYLSSVVDAALAPVVRLSAEGCSGCPVETRDQECYRAEPGGDFLCQGRDRLSCDAGSPPLVIDCDVGDSLECEPGVGWVPAATWAIQSANVVRSQDAGTQRYRILLGVSVAVDNRGASEVDVDSMYQWLEFFDENGTAIPLIVAQQGNWGGVLQQASAPGNTSGVYSFTFNSITDWGSPIWSATSLFVRAPVRPWAGAAKSGPIEVTLFGP